MEGNEIRKTFLGFFQNYQHHLEPSASLIPYQDPSLLFTNAGMVPFKKVFLNQETRPYLRATSVQKCVRAGGKHNDLEMVGKTARHHTFFEMLGNFSFGDYFKKEAIEFAWELITKHLCLPEKNLYVSVFKEDQEAETIWKKQIGLPHHKIFRLGKKDNFWSMGPTGPCGPCTELFIDRGPEFGCQKPSCSVGCACDRFIEFWNLVFMQYERKESGELLALPKKSVDTGAGLERLAMILQKSRSNYETDLFTPIFHSISEKTNLPYPSTIENQNVSFRVIADHLRAMTFLIADGVLPSNEGRGYVLRRIIRRAIRHGKKLGMEEPFLHTLSKTVIHIMHHVYPELTHQKELIKKTLFYEEKQFFQTLEKGILLFEETLSQFGTQKTFPGAIAFKLYDTYGFPLDLTRVMCEERKLHLDEAGFKKAMEEQKTRSRKSWKGSGEKGVEKEYFRLLEVLKKEHKLPFFTGYQELETKSTLLAIWEVDEKSQTLKKVSRISAIKSKKLLLKLTFHKTPFYGESGGQVGDMGWILEESGTPLAKITDVQKPISELTILSAELIEGGLSEGSTYIQRTDKKRRALIARNHSATHLLHWALRDTFGTHVKQAGSLVSAELLRFDFTHFQALTEAEIQKIEDKINQKIWAEIPIQKKELLKEEALKQGAIAFFGEKYGEKVRVVQIGDFSTELCGGTHIENTQEIGFFKIIHESSIAAGVRRIIAYSSETAMTFLLEKNKLLNQMAHMLETPTNPLLLEKIKSLLSSEQHLKKKLQHFEQEHLKNKAFELLKKAQTTSNGVFLFYEHPPHPEGMKHLRTFSDLLCQKEPHLFCVLAMKDPSNTKAYLLCTKGKQALKTLNCAEWIQALAPFLGGKGGGRPQFAQAGGKDLTQWSKFIEEVKKRMQQASKK